MKVKPYYIDTTPVTQTAFAAYLKKQEAEAAAAGGGPSALPTDRYHYLENWDWTDPTMPKPYAKNGLLPVRG